MEEKIQGAVKSPQGLEQQQVYSSPQAVPGALSNWVSPFLRRLRAAGADVFQLELQGASRSLGFWCPSAKAPTFL